MKKNVNIIGRCLLLVSVTGLSWIVGIGVAKTQELNNIQRLIPNQSVSNDNEIMHSPGLDPALVYHTLTPCRAYDVPFVGTFTYEMVIRGFCGVPAEAVAITYSVAAWQPAAQGNLLFWARDRNAKPLAVSLNYHPPVSSSGGVVELCNHNELATCEYDFLGYSSQTVPRVIIDVTGYYTIL